MLVYKDDEKQDFCTKNQKEKKKIKRSSKESYDMDLAKRLWDVSKKYVKLD